MIITQSTQLLPVQMRHNAARTRVCVVDAFVRVCACRGSSREHAPALDQPTAPGPHPAPPRPPPGHSRSHSGAWSPPSMYRSTITDPEGPGSTWPAPPLPPTTNHSTPCSPTSRPYGTARPRPISSARPAHSMKRATHSRSASSGNYSSYSRSATASSSSSSNPQPRYPSTSPRGHSPSPYLSHAPDRVRGGSARVVSYSAGGRNSSNRSSINHNTGSSSSSNNSRSSTPHHCHHMGGRRLTPPYPTRPTMSADPKRRTTTST